MRRKNRFKTSRNVIFQCCFQILQLKKEIEDRTHLHKNLEQLYDGRLKNIQTQLETATTKNGEYDKMVKYMRKKGAADKDNLVKVCMRI